MRCFLMSVVLSVFTILALGPQALASEFHVAVTGNDSSPGTRALPVRTIQHAAELAQPGDTITVHAGTYRERVNPPRGGTSESARIVYQAAKGEHVEIKGSEPVGNWANVTDNLWKTEVPNTVFGEFNPYSDEIHGDWFSPLGRVHHTGAVYLNGNWLIEAASLAELTNTNTATQSRQGGDEYLINIAWLRPHITSAKRIPAAQMSAKLGTQNAPCGEGGECVGFIRRQDWLTYTAVDCGKRCSEIEVRVAAASEGGGIEVHQDSATGPLLGSVDVPSTGGWQTWETYRIRTKPLSGPTNLCLVFVPLKRAALNAPLWFSQVGQTSTTLWAQFPGVNPNREHVEINVRRTVFYPDKPGRNFITVRGFILRDAATPWAPPTAEQIGVIGPHWSKGWIIENNQVSHSVCSGISLGKYGDAWDNKSADSAEGYVETIHRGLIDGWNRDTIGHHIVRNNEVSHCEQAGIVGSLGAAFSTISGNTIHDIHVRRLFTGAEMAGIKFHGAIDTVIKGNHIFRTCLGLWLDWMAQGTRVSGNTFHHNALDVFTEVDHGPFVVDNNLFLSAASFQSCSRGGAFVHNLYAGAINIFPYDGRLTPYLKSHSTELGGLHDNPRGDDRYYNNIFMQPVDLSQYNGAKLPVAMDGNVYLRGAKPCAIEADPLISDADIAMRIVGSGTEFTLQLTLDAGWKEARQRKIVNTRLLGIALIPQLPFEQADASQIHIDYDFAGTRRDSANPSPGPFENLLHCRIVLKAHDK